MTTGATVPSLKDRVTTVRDLILANRGAIEMALPKFMNTDRLIRTALTSIATTPGLLDCTPRSLLGAIVQSAQLGLEPGVLGMAYLLPFRNRRNNTTEVQFIPGYRGLLAIARRSGEISTIFAQLAHAKDRFAFQFGTDPKIDHIPNGEADRGPVTHVYAVARLKDGAVQFDVMTKGDIDAHRDRYSRAAKDGPWVTAWEEMAKKTVLRRLCKMLPASIELQTAVVLSEKAEYQLPQDLGNVVDIQGPGADDSDAPNGHQVPQGSSTLDSLAASMPETPTSAPAA